MTPIVARAHEMLAEYRVRVPKGFAVPFGIDVPSGIEWRVSSDVWRVLWDEVAMTGQYVPVPDPLDHRLLGIPILPDADLPPNSMLLISA